MNEVLGPIHLKSEVEGSGVEGHPQLHSKSDASLGYLPPYLENMRRIKEVFILVPSIQSDKAWPSKDTGDCPFTRSLPSPRMTRVTKRD